MKINFKEISKKLDLSVLAMIWKKLTGGWAGVAQYICTKFTNLLKKVPAEDLKNYADLTAKVSRVLGAIVSEFLQDSPKENAACATVKAFETLAIQLGDGVMTVEELNKSIDNIKDCVELWKKA